MKAFCVSLVAALCFGLAYSITCYNCTTSSDNCLSAATCLSSDLYCRTVVTVSSGATQVMKSCHNNCSADGVQGQISYFTCCQTDLCNKRGASDIVSGSVTVSYSGMSLALGLSALLFKTIL